MIYLVWERNQFYGAFSVKGFETYGNELDQRYKDGELTWSSWAYDEKNPHQKVTTGYLVEKKAKVPVIHIVKTIVDGVYF
jgi:hypothetical protein